MQIKNIIFDLGGVILNIDYNLTINAFKTSGIENFDNLYTQAQQSSLFDDLETGKISPNDFYISLRNISKSNISDIEIEKAWNAMLLDLPKERIDLLNQVKTNYNIFLFSNTNIIHFEAYKKYIDKTFGFDFNALFKKAYYSHEIGMRKPNKNGFEHILTKNNLNASETLFIDDSIQHIQGAGSLGINTYHLTDKTILNLFNDNGNLILSEF